MNDVHVGRISSDMIPDLKEISALFQRLYPEEVKKDKTFHVSVNDVADKRLLELVNHVRMNPIFKHLFCADTSNMCHVENLTEMDEIYYSYPNYTGSDANMFISHYDGPYTIKITEYVRVYRFLIAITPNSTVSTHFPHKDQAVTLDFGDYVGWDYNNELHFVSGFAQVGKPRILLKIHFAVCDPCQSKQFLQKVKGWHAWYLHTLRNEHNESKEVQTIELKRHAFILNAGRYVYTHIYWFLAAFVISLICFAWYLSFPKEFVRTLGSHNNTLWLFIVFIVPFAIGTLTIPTYFPTSVKVRLVCMLWLVAFIIAYSFQCMLAGKCYAWSYILWYVLFGLPLIAMLIIFLSPYFMAKATFHY